MNTSLSFSAQIKTFLFYLFSLLFWGVIALVAINLISPPWMSKITDYVEQHLVEWDELACQVDQLGCLEFKQKELQSLDSNMKISLNKLNKEIDKMDFFISQRKTIKIRNSELIAEGERILTNLTVTQEPVNIWLAGKHFTKKENFNLQVKLLKQEKMSIEQQLSKAIQIKSKMSSNRESLQLKKGSLSLQIKLIPAQLALLKSSEYLVGFDDNISQIDELISSSYQDMSSLSNEILTTQDFMDSAKLNAYQE